MVLDALVALHFALSFGIENISSVLSDFFSLVPTLIDYRYDTTLSVQVYTLKCIKELSVKTGYVPFQTHQFFESLKDPLIYESLSSCLDFKVFKTDKKYCQKLATTWVKSISEFVHPVEGDIFQFPCIFQTENSLSTEVIECSQDITIRFSFAKALIKQNALSSITELIASQDLNVRTSCLKILYQLTRFSTEFSKQILSDNQLLTTLLSMIRDTSELKAMYETELATLVLSNVFKDSPKIIGILGRDVDAVVATCFSIVNTSLDERFKCFAVLLLGRLASNVDIRKRIVSEIFTPLGMSKVNDIIVKDVSR